MNINLCGACGWLGSDAELVAYGVSIEIKPELKSIIETNGLTAKCCPVCKSPFIFSKGTADFSISNPPGGVIPWIPNYSSRQPIADMVGMPEGAMEKDAKIGTEEAVGEIIERSVSPIAEEVTSVSENEDADIDVSIVSDILSKASGENAKLETAKDLADGLNKTSKQVIADIAEVPVEELNDKPKKPKVASKPRLSVQKKENRTCDDCGKKFHSAIKQSKCPDCTRAFMQKYVTG